MVKVSGRGVRRGDAVSWLVGSWDRELNGLGRQTLSEAVPNQPTIQPTNSRPQPPLQILYQVLGILQPHRHAQEISRRDRRWAFDGCAVLDEGFRSTEARRAREELEAVGEVDRGLLAAADLNAQHAAEAAHLARGDGMSGMRGESRIVDRLDRRMTGEEAGNGHCVLAVAPHAPRQ